MIVEQQAVQKHGEISGLHKLFAFEFGGFENNVIGLPLTRPSRWIYERRPLAIDGSGLAIRVSRVVVGIQDLYFVAAHEYNPAVATRLTVPAYLGRRGPLDVQLAVAEFLFGGDVARVWDHFDVAVFELPLRFAPAPRPPNPAMLHPPPH